MSEPKPEKRPAEPPFKAGDWIQSPYNKQIARVKRCHRMSNGQWATIAEDAVGRLITPLDAAPGEPREWLVVGTQPSLLDVLDTTLLAVDAIAVPALRERRKNGMENLAMLAELRAFVDRHLPDAVAAARELGNYWDNGASWEAIGKQLGVTKQSAQAKYSQYVNSKHGQ